MKFNKINIAKEEEIILINLFNKCRIVRESYLKRGYLSDSEYLEAMVKEYTSWLSFNTLHKEEGREISLLSFYQDKFGKKKNLLKVVGLLNPFICYHKEINNTVHYLPIFSVTKKLQFVDEFIQN